MSARFRSRLYDCVVTHTRQTPVRHRFDYRYFTFCLDLDEIDAISETSRLFGTSPGKAFRFFGPDFIFGKKDGGPRALKAAVIELARQKGVRLPIARVELVAHMRTFGYAFNPAAFYFCYGESGEALCAILEVTNTYLEKKAYFLHGDALRDGRFDAREAKFFYVSPFVELDSDFQFRLAPPGERLRLGIDSIREGVLQVGTLVTGRSTELSDAGLLLRAFRFPLVTARVMLAIHVQAFLLYLKKVPFIRKSDRTELQKGGLP